MSKTLEFRQEDEASLEKGGLFLQNGDVNSAEEVGESCLILVGLQRTGELTLIISIQDNDTASPKTRPILYIRIRMAAQFQPRDIKRHG